MASTYPTTLDSFSTASDNATPSTTTHPALHNDANDAINKIEAELGTAPSATHATVTARLATFPTHDFSDLVCAPSLWTCSAVNALTANRLLLARAVVPKTGNLRDLSVYMGATSGNVRGAVYDSGEAAGSGTITRLWDGSSTAAGTANNWQALGDPNLAVVQGQQVVLAFMADNATATWGSNGFPNAAFSTMPVSFLASGNSISQKIVSHADQGSFTTPTTIAYSGTANQQRMFAIVARIS